LAKGFAKQKIAGRVWNVDNGLSIEQLQKTLQKIVGKKDRCRWTNRCQRSHPLQQLCSNRAATPWWEKLDGPLENAGHKINHILFFYPDTIHYICDNQLKAHPYERST